MRIVVKIGTSTLVAKDSALNRKYIYDLVSELVAIQKENHEILIVSSGDGGAGRLCLGANVKSKTLRDKQAFAAIGQPLLMNTYSAAFAKYDKTVAQILLTRDLL
ncbi:hypothetical protein AGMMS49593_04030 [Endomicrobiia bacterium]|nr:hypothetical protein AGMMS49593_04030 [Endomicrobiia bacterium]GHT44723.1 hypothetical protein AGMMS49936_00620 [Endomicrobiia bacterium]